MRHRKHKWTLDRNANQRRALVRNLARSLILHGRITTTSARARALRPFVEKLVTVIRPGTLHARREAIQRLGQAAAADQLIRRYGEKYKTRSSGYTRSIKLMSRAGDGASRVMIEFV